MKRTAISIVGIALSLGLVVGCGGGGDDNDARPVPTQQSTAPELNPQQVFERDCINRQGALSEPEGPGDDKLCTFPDGTTAEFDIDDDEDDKAIHKPKKPKKPKSPKKPRSSHRSHR